MMAALRRMWRRLFNPEPLPGTRWRVDQMGIAFIEKRGWRSRHLGEFLEFQPTSTLGFEEVVYLVTRDGTYVWTVGDLRRHGAPLVLTAFDMKELDELERNR